MSNAAQGPGWWIASDGRWYPPELHPSAQPVAVAATVPQGPPPVVVPQGPPIATVPQGPPIATVPEVPPIATVPEVPPVVTPRRPGSLEDFVGAASGYGQPEPAGAVPEEPAALPSFWQGPAEEESASAPPAAGIPAPPPVVIPQVQSSRPSSGGGVAPGGNPASAPPAPGGVDMANGPGRGRSPAGTPAGGYGGGQRGPMGPLSPYEEGLYSGAGTTRQRRKHFPIWTVLIVVVVVVAGGLLYLHIRKASNVHQSPAAIAENYVSAVASNNTTQLKADVVPGEKPVIVSTIPTGGLTFATANRMVVGADTDITVLACANLYAGASCSMTIVGSIEGTIPTKRINGSWYVDTSNLPACGPGQDLICLRIP